VNTDQARRLIALHENYDRALLNLRNAEAMAGDDPRSAELLEEAGDSYAGALAELVREQAGVAVPFGTSDAPSAPEKPSGDSGKGQGAEEG